MSGVDNNTSDGVIKNTAITGGEKRQRKEQKELSAEELEKRRQKELWEAHLPDLFEMWANCTLLYDDTHKYYHNRDRCSIVRNNIYAELSLCGKFIVVYR